MGCCKAPPKPGFVMPLPRPHGREVKDDRLSTRSFVGGLLKDPSPRHIPEPCSPMRSASVLLQPAREPALMQDAPPRGAFPCAFATDVPIHAPGSRSQHERSAVKRSGMACRQALCQKLAAGAAPLSRPQDGRGCRWGALRNCTDLKPCGSQTGSPARTRHLPSSCQRSPAQRSFKAPRGKRLTIQRCFKGYWTSMSGDEELRRWRPF